MRSIKLIFIFSLFILVNTAFAADFPKIITVAAERFDGVAVELDKGTYLASIAGGAMTLFFPINPNYCWLIGVSVGINVKGGQDEPNIGTIYFEPKPIVLNQADAERLALAAKESGTIGTSLEFKLDKPQSVRFWVSDYDYSDNSGMVKIKIDKK